MSRASNTPLLIGGAAVGVLLLAAAGCLKVKQLVLVNPDGSGNIVADIPEYATGTSHFTVVTPGGTVTSTGTYRVDGPVPTINAERYLGLSMDVS